MDFQSNRERPLSLLLRQSLQNVLTEVCNDASPFNLQNASRLNLTRDFSRSALSGSGNNMTSMASLFPSSHQPMLSLSSGLQSPATRPSAWLGLNSQPQDNLLLAAAAEKLMAEQHNAAAAAAAIRQGSFLQASSQRGNSSSLLGLFQRSVVGSELGLFSTATKGPHDTLEELGSSLRAKAAPYIDVANAADPDPNDPKIKRTRGGVTEPFPERLHRLLQEIAKDGNGDVISFLPHGRAFVIHKPEKFASEIMPVYFKQKTLSSFQRQLNLYGFKKVQSGRDAGAYYHELFLQSRPNMCLLMRRVGLPKGDDRRKMRSKNVQVDPDFYSYPFCSSETRA